MSSQTTFRYLDADDDWKAAYSFIQDEGGTIPKSGFAFPSLLAFRNGEIVGFIGRREHPEQIILGEMRIRVVGNPAFLHARLLDMWEKTIIAAGVESYIFYVDDEDAERYERILQQAEGWVEPYSAAEHGTWYKKVLIHVSLEDPSSGEIDGSDAEVVSIH